MLECSSGVGTPNIGEMKGNAFDFGQRELFKVEFYRKLLKAPKMVLLKVSQRVRTLHNHLLAKVKHLLFNLPEIGVPTPL